MGMPAISSTPWPREGGEAAGRRRGGDVHQDAMAAATVPSSPRDSTRLSSEEGTAVCAADRSPPQLMFSGRRVGRGARRQEGRGRLQVLGQGYSAPKAGPGSENAGISRTMGLFLKSGGVAYVAEGGC